MKVYVEVYVENDSKGGEYGKNGGEVLLRHRFQMSDISPEECKEQHNGKSSLFRYIENDINGIQFTVFVYKYVLPENKKEDEYYIALFK